MRKVSPESAPATSADAPAPAPTSAPECRRGADPRRLPEIGGFKGPEPTRYGDWEHNGRCTDF